MNQNLLMLDSGAFSVWTQGASLDIHTYIEFCQAHPGVSYYVNLDSIPGKPGERASAVRQPHQIEKACQESWNNYQEMIKVLPHEKVIPVFHRGERIKWLRKYLDFGIPYLGIGQAVAFGGKQNQMKWLREIRPHIVDSMGGLKLKTHGFAITAFSLMSFMPWHSVDSTSWLKQAAYGIVYIPQIRKGVKYYNEPPFLLNVSPKSPKVDEPGAHLENLPPNIKERILSYLNEKGIKLGRYDLVSVSEGYKKKDDELWWDKTKRSVLRIQEKGIITSHQHRFRANARFIFEANKVLPVEHIYFAGGEGSIDDSTEYRLGRRLMSYHKIGGSEKTKGRRVFEDWCQLTGNGALV